MIAGGDVTINACDVVIGFRDVVIGFRDVVTSFRAGEEALTRERAALLATPRFRLEAAASPAELR